jgi:hypothetical protein
VKTNKRALLLIPLALLGACVRVTVLGHTVTEGTAPGKQKAETRAAAVEKLTPQQLAATVSAITLEIAPALQQQIAADARFDADALRAAITDELRSRRLLDTSAAAAGRVAVVQVAEYSVRPTSNAVVFGHIPSTGVLGGAVLIRDAEGAELRGFRIRADIPLNIAQRGTEPNALRNLYLKFAELAADDLAATADSR